MKISVFGMGYVGCVSAACMAQDGHTVIGVDVNPNKVHQLESGCSPISEPDLSELLGKVVPTGMLRVTMDGKAAVHQSDVSLICVGTPSNPMGGSISNLSKMCAREIGLAVKTKPGYHVIVVRSTVLPGTVQDQLIPTLEQHSQRDGAGSDFGVGMNRNSYVREARSRITMRPAILSSANWISAAVT